MERISLLLGGCLLISLKIFPLLFLRHMNGQDYSEAYSGVSTYFLN